VSMRKSECSKQKLRAQGRPRNGDISLFQRFLAIDKTVPTTTAESEHDVHVAVDCPL